MAITKISYRSPSMTLVWTAGRVLPTLEYQYMVADL